MRASNLEAYTANVYDGTAFQEIVGTHQPYMVIFSDTGFRKADWHPENLKICQRGEWNSRMIVETVLSMLTLIDHFKKVTSQKEGESAHTPLY